MKTQMKNSSIKSIRAKLVKCFRRVCCGCEKLVPKRHTIVKKRSFLGQDEFNIQKWHKQIQKTCHDFDAMETTFNTSTHNATLNSLRSNGDVYRSELRQMQTEIKNLRREKDMIQRGLQPRQGRSQQVRTQLGLRRARNSHLVRQHQRYLRYRSDSAYSSSTPTQSTYQSNDRNVFYVFL